MILEMINKGEFHEYLKEGRLLLLSKEKDSDSPTIEKTRPIVIKKVIINRIQKGKMDFIRTGEYQSSFNEGESTATNMAKLMDHIGRTCR